MVLTGVGPVAEKEQELRKIEGHPCGAALGGTASDGQTTQLRCLSWILTAR